MSTDQKASRTELREAVVISLLRSMRIIDLY